MTLDDLQKWVHNDWANASKQMPSGEMQLLYIIEEFGEVAEAIRKSAGHKDRKAIDVDLGSEFADLLVAITTLANTNGIDLTREVSRFQQRMAARHDSGF